MEDVWYYIHKNYDFHDHQAEVGSIADILSYIGENGYEVIHFNRYPSAQNPHYTNITFTAKGKRPLMFNGRPMRFEWWGGDLSTVIVERQMNPKSATATESPRGMR